MAPSSDSRHSGRLTHTSSTTIHSLILALEALGEVCLTLDYSRADLLPGH